MTKHTDSSGPEGQQPDPGAVPYERQASVFYSSSDSAEAQADITFVLQHWEAFAASAWDCFKLYGRGALLIERRDQVPSTTYDTEPHLHVVEDDPLHWTIHAHVQHYDPTVELVVVVVDATVRIYRLRAEVIAPPEASLRSLEIQRTLAA